MKASRSSEERGTPICHYCHAELTSVYWRVGIPDVIGSFWKVCDPCHDALAELREVKPDDLGVIDSDADSS